MSGGGKPIGTIGRIPLSERGSGFPLAKNGGEKILIIVCGE